ncbi:crossover junction endodeoxyribonuclease RuvC [Acetobacteraceae bacterium]|nr:crossover junction endodeoxyribonuclease RuvC [Acetobacteraceae bacterium]
MFRQSILILTFLTKSKLSFLNKLSSFASITRKSSSSVRILGLDPGLRFLGWGVVEASGNRIVHLADGILATDSAMAVPDRLCTLYQGIEKVIETYSPTEAAVEETYVNVNGAATLKLGYARAMALLVPAQKNLLVAEYGAKEVKLAVVGTGQATKQQVILMVKRLLPAATLKRADAADALAMAICHAYRRAANLRIASGRVSA